MRSTIRNDLTLISLCLWAGAFFLSGCQDKTLEKNKQVHQQRRLMSMVIDQPDAMAWSCQIEGAALQQLLASPLIKTQNPSGDPEVGPTAKQLIDNPAAYRGQDVSFTGKLLETLLVKVITPEGKSFSYLRGCLLTADGSLIGVALPGSRLLKTGAAFQIKGRFLKRWMLLNAGGDQYVTMPMIAVLGIFNLKNELRDKLAALKAPPGLLPLKTFDIPEVWSRPILEVSAGGQLLLDGQVVDWPGLLARLAPLAAEHRNPLGDSALAVVVLLEKGTSRAIRKRIEALHKSLGAKCVIRIGKH
jgi:hypothetical protein